MRFSAELAPGLRADVEIHQPSSADRSDLTVSSEVVVSGQFRTDSLGLQQGPNRTFTGRLRESIDLLEEVRGRALCTFAQSFGNLPLSVMQEEPLQQQPTQLQPILTGKRFVPLGVPASPARSVPVATAIPRPITRDDLCMGHYRRPDCIPAPPASKPWLAKGGRYVLDGDEGRFFNTSVRLMKRNDPYGSSKWFYILAFVAHKHITKDGSPDQHYTSTFSATKVSQATRERHAIAWLSAGSDLNREDSNDDSTIARMTG